MEKLLIVGELAKDDELSGLFEREGYEVWGAEGCSEALEQVRRGGFGLLVVSQCLGDCDGLDLIRDVQDSNPECDVILISAGPRGVELATDEESQNIAVDALAEGALDYLRRPIDLKQLRTALSFARSARAGSTHESYPPDEFIAAE